MIVSSDNGDNDVGMVLAWFWYQVLGTLKMALGMVL